MSVKALKWPMLIGQSFRFISSTSGGPPFSISPQPKPKKDSSASPKKRGDDLAAVTGTSLDKGVELDALAKTN
jgi:hypothetical protein